MIDAAGVVGEIFWFGDDFASQKGMLVSPEAWRRYLKPVYRAVFALAKSRGMKVWFHSCGQFRPVLPDLVEIGMDVWETSQVHLAGNEPEVLVDLTFSISSCMIHAWRQKLFLWSLMPMSGFEEQNARLPSHSLR